MNPHKTDAAWFADLRQTARSVKKHNEVSRRTDPVELSPDEVLELVRLAETAGTGMETPVALKCIHGKLAYARCEDCENDQMGFQPALNR